MKDVCSKIKQIINSFEKQMIIVAIDGRCAVGKTTFADLLKKETGCSVIHMDHFFLRKKQRTKQRMQEVGGNVESRKEAFSYQVFKLKK